MCLWACAHHDTNEANENARVNHKTRLTHAIQPSDEQCLEVLSEERVTAALVSSTMVAYPTLDACAWHRWKLSNAGSPALSLMMRHHVAHECISVSALAAIASLLHVLTSCARNTNLPLNHYAPRS